MDSVVSGTGNQLCFHLSRRDLVELPEWFATFPSPENVQKIFLNSNYLSSLHGLRRFTNLNELHLAFAIDPIAYSSNQNPMSSGNPDVNPSGDNSEPVGRRVIFQTKSGSSGTITRGRRTVMSDEKVVDESKSNSTEVIEILQQVKDSKEKDDNILHHRQPQPARQRHSFSSVLPPPFASTSPIGSGSSSSTTSPPVVLSPRSSTSGTLVDSVLSSFSSISSSMTAVNPKKVKPVKLPVAEFVSLSKLETLFLSGCFLSPHSLTPSLSSLPLVALHLSDNPSLGAFLCGSQPEASLMVVDDVQTFSVNTFSSSFGSPTTTPSTTSTSTSTSSSSVPDPEEIHSHPGGQKKVQDQDDDLSIQPVKESDSATPTSPLQSPRNENNRRFKTRFNDSSWFLFKSLSPTLHSLSLSNCDLQSFPLSLCQCVSLTSLDLSLNYIRRLPPQLSSLTSLTSLFLDQTKLTDVPSSLFPASSSFCSSLKDLSLSRNYISVFPECILSLTSLVNLDLSYNDITLDLHNHHFETILQSHHQLATLNLAGNPFCQSLSDPKWIPEPVRGYKFIRCETSLPVEVMPSLFIGTTVSSFNKHALKQLSVTHILSLVPRWIPVYPYIFKYKVIEVEDKEQSNIRQYFREAIDFISGAIHTNGVVMVHCTSGLSQSATVILAYLISEHRMTLKNAMETVKTKKEICPNAGFLRQLEQWEASELPLVHWSNKITNALFATE